MSQEPESLVGQVLANTYMLEQLLISGGMGAVYAGRHVRTGGACAVKVLHRESASNTEIYERFQDEARISCSLRHPHIVQVMDLSHPDDGTPFLVMELLEGEDLQQRLDRQGRLSFPDVLALARQVGSALHAAHSREVVHRDLKPQNIFLCRTEVDGRVIETAKVLDFGLSKIRRPAAKVTRDLLVLGTPKYLAPEGALGQNSQLDGRADQFSLAVIFYRALSGRLPFDSEDVAEVLRQVVYEDAAPLRPLVPELPEHALYAIERAMNKDKEDRFETMLDFIQSFSGIGAAPTSLSLVPSAPPAQPGPRPPSGEARSGALTGIAPVPPDLSTKGTGAHSTGKGFNEAPTFIAPVPALLLQAALASEPIPPAGDRLTPLRAPEPTPVPAAAALQEEPPLAAPERRSPRLVWWRTLGAFGVGAVLVTPILLAARAPKLPAPGSRSTGAVERRRDPAEQARERRQRFHDAVRAGDLDAARAAYQQLQSDPELQRTLESLQARFAERKLGEAEDVLRSGDCAGFYHHVREALRYSPAHPAALAARWRPCGAAIRTAPAPDVNRPPVYPPLRLAPPPPLAPAGAAVAGVPTADQLLLQARAAYDQSAYRKAIELAHVVVGQGEAATQQAYQVMVAAACARGDLRLAGTALARLDSAWWGFLDEECQISQRGLAPR